MMRDLLKDKAWLDEWTAFISTAISDCVDIAKRPSGNPAYRPQYIRDLAFMNLTLMLRRYSRGDDTADLSEYFGPLLHYWEESERLGNEVWTPAQQRIQRTWSINLDFYMDCFWLVGLALSLDMSDSLWQRLMVLVGNEGEDALLDRIIATRTPSRKICSSLCYPKPYGRLLEAIDAPASRQPEMLSRFVDQWYEEVGSAARAGRDKQAVPYKTPYWRGIHLMEGGYFGFWCLEAVAAVKAFQLDDSLCLGHPHYPGDLLRPGIVTEPDVTRLLPELAATIGDPAAIPPLTEEPMTMTWWEAFKLVLKNRFFQ